MSGDDKQLLIGGIAALAVLGLGLGAWLFASQPAPSEPPRDADKRVPVEADKALVKGDPGQTQRAQKPLLTSTVREPRVRPEHLVHGVERSLNEQKDAFAACYATELERKPNAKGRALLQLSIDENSEVSGLNVELRGIASMGLKTCLMNATQAVVFGEIEEPALVWWPLDMWPDRGLIIQSAPSE